MTDLIQDLETGLRNLTAQNQEFRRHRLSAIGRCVRARVYRARQVPESNEADLISLVAMARGNDIETLALNILRASGGPFHSFQKEVKLTVPGVGDVLGHVDCLYADDGVIDVKGVNASGWWRIQNQGPHDSYVEQVNAYCEAENRKWGAILYVNRDGIPKDEFPFLPITFPYNAELAARGKASIALVEAAVDGPIPPRPYASASEFPCSFCSWRDHCWGEAVAASKARPDLALVLEEVQGGDSLIATLNDYQSVLDGLDHLEDRKKDLRVEIMSALERFNTRTVSGGGYRANLSVRSTSRLDKKLIPSEILEAATSTSEFEVLTVRKV